MPCRLLIINNSTGNQQPPSSSRFVWALWATGHDIQNLPEYEGQALWQGESTDYLTDLHLQLQL